MRSIKEIGRDVRDKAIERWKIQSGKLHHSKEYSRDGYSW